MIVLEELQVAVAPLDRPRSRRLRMAQAGDREPGVLTKAVPRWPHLDDVGGTPCGLFTDRRSGREATGEGGVEQRPRDLFGLLGRRCPHRLRLIAVLVAGASQAVELSRCLLCRRLVEHRAQVAAERLVLAWPVGRPEAVRRQQRLAGVVTGVVGDAVPDGELVSSGSWSKRSWPAAGTRSPARGLRARRRDVAPRPGRGPLSVGRG